MILIQLTIPTLPMKTYKNTTIPIVLIALALTACGDDSEYSSADDYDDDYTEGGYYSDSQAEDSFWRPGNVKIDFNFQQEQDFQEHNGEKHTNLQSDYALIASYEQKVQVIDDLSASVPIDPNLSGQALLDAYTRGSPFYVPDSAPKPEISGALTWNRLFYGEKPGRNGTEIIKNTSSAEGRVTYIDLDHVDISQFGVGYQFDIKVVAQTDVKRIEENNLFGTNAVNNTQGKVDNEVEFSFYPKLDKSVLDRYPFEVELAGVSQQVIDAAKNNTNQIFDRYSKIDQGKVPYRGTELFGTITEASKDKLVIRYVHDGGPIPSYIDGAIGIIEPVKNVLELKITITAD